MNKGKQLGIKGDAHHLYGDHMIVAAITHEIDEVISGLGLKSKQLINSQHINSTQTKYRNQTIVNRNHYKHVNDNKTYIVIHTKPSSIRYTIQDDYIVRTTTNNLEKIIQYIWNLCDPDAIDKVVENIIRDIAEAKYPYPR